MELKLVTEIKERADQKSRNLKDSPIGNETVLAVSGISHDPVAQLVTELSQSFNLEKPRKNSQGSIKLPESNHSGSNFLKRTTTDSIIDFKSRLRKVDSAGDRTQDGGADDETKRESTASSDSGNLKIDDGDDKRKSTGSISSLKKLWEPKETGEGGNSQLSPKLAPKNNTKNGGEEVGEGSPIETSDDSGKGRKTWPPSGDDKPVIPTKPPVKATKPIIAGRPAGPAIYATPIAPAAGNKPPIMAKPANLENKTPDEETRVRCFTY